MSIAPTATIATFLLTANRLEDLVRDVEIVWDMECKLHRFSVAESDDFKHMPAWRPKGAHGSPR